MEPGKPKNIWQLIREIRKSLGVKQFRPEISVISLVLKRLVIESTRRKESVEINAWLINIAKLANIKGEWPLITQIVSQCISKTVEQAINFFKSR